MSLEVRNRNLVWDRTTEYLGHAIIARNFTEGIVTVDLRKITEDSKGYRPYYLPVATSHYKWANVRVVDPISRMGTYVIRGLLTGMGSWGLFSRKWVALRMCEAGRVA